MGNVITLLWPWPSTQIPRDDVVNGNATPAYCDGELSREYTWQIIVLSTAAAIFLLLNILKSFKNNSSRLDIVVPIKILHSTPFRLVYCFIMTLWAADVMQNLLRGHNYYRDLENSIIDVTKVLVLSPIVIIMKQALIYFPVLACVDFSFSILGHFLGLAYVLLMGSYSIYKESVYIRGCFNGKPLANKDIGVELGVMVPVFLGYLLMASWFFYQVVRESVLKIFTRYKLKNRMSECGHMTQFHEHVKHLLKRKKPVYSLRPYRKNFLLRFLIDGLDYVLPYGTTFQYPLPFLAAITMSWIVIYQFCLHLISKEVEFANNAIDFINSFNITVETLEKFLSKKWAHHLDNLFYDFKSFTEFLLIVPPFGTSIAFGLLAFFNMYLIQNVHKHFERAARGDLNFLVNSEPLPSRAYILAATMKYTSFQVGYMILGWVIYVFMLISLLTFGLIFYYLFKNLTFLGVHIWSWFMIPMMWSAGMHYLQLFLCRYVFLDRRDEGEVIVVRFQCSYQFLIYVFFFFNVIFAAVMSFLRVFASLMFTIVMYVRLDWDVYMRGLEGWDFGHRTYIGYVYMEYTYNNAILRTFAQLLLDAVKGPTEFRRNFLESSLKHTINHEEGDTQPCLDTKRRDGGPPQRNITQNGRKNYKSVRNLQQSRLARNRWFLAYTLISNPIIRKNHSHFTLY